MPDLRKNLAIGLNLGMVLSLLLGVAAPNFADVMHYVNGKVVRGKLYRLTGDIIEFKEETNFGPQIHIHRIQLTNRHDIVSLKNNQRYFGEIIYLDRFKLDLKTATGMVKLNRMKIDNVVMGTPGEYPVANTEVMPVTPPAFNGQAGKPVVQFPAGNEPLPTNPESSMDSDGEDQDTIPAVY